jgi:hypothetical protein
LFSDLQSDAGDQEYTLGHLKFTSLSQSQEINCIFSLTLSVSDHNSEKIAKEARKEIAKEES